MTISEKSITVHLSELKTNPTKTLKQLAKNQIILQKRNKPVAVLISYRKFRKLERRIDSIESNVLGLIAKQRFENTSKSQYLPLKNW
ncbi:MAG: type II toxin-antitoxin system Phd/YefM family antitoxin [Candidatus Omnitrophica bacterium]|nr:type II toxin-antitoxin system Phd/YefM family antitoxin [Candidatus Omnitrophota bacterium]